jgi:signal transduction histidine kinase
MEIIFPGKRKLQAQLVLIMLAGISVAACAALLVVEAVKGAERVILSDANGVLAEATGELSQQYTERLKLGSGFLDLPVAAQSVSLRGISEAVLTSYPGVEGGYFREAHFLGYSFPTHDNPSAKTDVPVPEMDTIRAAAETSLRQKATVVRTLRDPYEIVLIRAQPDVPENTVAWAMKRVPLTDPAGRWNWLLVALVIAALFGVAGTLATALSLRRGVREIAGGLDRLEQDFHYRMPEPNSELGVIGRAINKMAAARRQLEADLRREDRLRAMGRLIAGIAHEIRNPLNGIRLSIELLERRLKDHSASPEELRRVIGEVDRLDALLKHLFIFDKGAPPALETLPLAPLIERSARLVEPQASARGVTIEAAGLDPSAVATCNAAQLNQVLLNLLLNALEAVEKAGSIVVGLKQHSSVVEITVSDTGPGLPEEQQDRVFEAFYTTKANGAGLGLAVSRELIENMGGRLYYRNTGPEAAFVIELRPASHV